MYGFMTAVMFTNMEVDSCIQTNSHLPALKTYLFMTTSQQTEWKRQNNDKWVAMQQTRYTLEHTVVQSGPHAELPIFENVASQSTWTLCAGKICP